MTEPQTEELAPVVPDRRSESGVIPAESPQTPAQGGLLLGGNAAMSRLLASAEAKGLLSSRPVLTLADVVRPIEEMRLVSADPPRYAMKKSGQDVIIEQEERDRLMLQVLTVSRKALARVKMKADGAETRYKTQHAINADQWFVSGVVHFFGGIRDPGQEVTSQVNLAREKVDAANVALEQGKLEEAARCLAEAETHGTLAERLARLYSEKLISTGESTVSVLEVTRDAAMAATVAIGAVVAAPVIAAGAAGFTSSTAGAALLTAAGTGGTVGLGGAALRGGSSALGTAWAGGSMAQVAAVVKAEGRRGFQEGFAAGAGGGAAQVFGKALGVGLSASRLVNMGRGAMAQAVGGGVGSASSTALEGGDVGDVLASFGTGSVIGAVSSPLTQLVGRLANPSVRGLASVGVGAAQGGFMEYAHSGDVNRAFRAAAIGGGSAVGAFAQPSTGPSRVEQRAFKLGQTLRGGRSSALSPIGAEAGMSIALQPEDLMLEEYEGAPSGEIVTLKPQSRWVNLSRPDLLNKYETLANEKIPMYVLDILKGQQERPVTQTRSDLQRLRTRFERLRQEVGKGPLSEDQRADALEILRDARRLSGLDFKNVQRAIWRRLRADRELRPIEEQMVSEGDARASSGALRIRTAISNDVNYEPLTLEHKVRRSDNPWLYNDADNLIVTDAPQNEQFLEALRRQGYVWPTSDIEDFVVRHRLNDQGVSFAPAGRK